MKLQNALLINVLAATLLAPPESLATNNLPTVGTLPDIIFVRKDCGTTPDCSTTIGEATNWIGNTRKPTANRAVTIDIGPGKFNETTNCTSYTSWHGAGPDQTIIGNGLQAFGCTKFHVSSLMITGGFPGPVYWQGGGDSTWENVYLNGDAYAWTETSCNATTGRAKHQWFNSRLSSNNKGYLASCSENWFWGTEIAVTASVNFPNPRAIIALYQPTFGIAPEFHVYGSNIKLVIPDGVTTAEPQGGGECAGTVAICSSGPGASVHIHGTGIDVVGNSLPNNIVVLAADNGAEIHANSSSYNLSTGANGRVQRILKGVTGSGGHIHAPYLWEHIPKPETMPNFTSIDGVDMTTIIASDGFPHSVVYSNKCPANARWYDQVDKVCR